MHSFQYMLGMYFEYMYQDTHQSIFYNKEVISPIC